MTRSLRVAFQSIWLGVRAQRLILRGLGRYLERYIELLEGYSRYREHR